MIMLSQFDILSTDDLN